MAMKEFAAKVMSNAEPGLKIGFLSGGILMGLVCHEAELYLPLDYILMFIYGSTTAAIMFGAMTAAVSPLFGRALRRFFSPLVPKDISRAAALFFGAALFFVYFISPRLTMWVMWENNTSFFAWKNMRVFLPWGLILFGAAALFWMLSRRFRILEASWKLGLFAPAIAIVWICLFMSRVAPPPENDDQLAGFPVNNVQKTGVKVCVIGIDGGCWSVMEPLAEEGLMPNVKRLMDEGSWGDIYAPKPHNTMSAWTSIATGKSTSKHTLIAHLVFKLPGVSPFPLERYKQKMLPLVLPGLVFGYFKFIEAVPYPSYMPKSRPMWEILSRGGNSVMVDGWPVTWPAAEVNGMIVSDRVPYSVWEVFYRHSDSLEGLTYPEGLRAELGPFVKKPRDISLEEMSKLFQPNEDEMEEVRKMDLNVLNRPNLSLFGRTYCMDVTEAAVTEHLLDKKGQPDFLGMYLTSFDFSSHIFWGYHVAMQTGELNGLDPDKVRRYGPGMRNSAMMIDSMIGRIVSKLDPQTAVFLISDSGIGEPPKGYIWDSGHTTDGLFLASGGPIVKGAKLPEKAITYDLAPTVLYLLGTPIDKDMDGKVLEDIISPEFRASYQPQYVDTYRKSD